MKQLAKVGVIGPGWIWQEEHIRGYRTTTNGYIVGFYDVNRDLAETACTAYKADMEKRFSNAKTDLERTLCQKALEAKVYDDFEVLLGDIQCVDIATPPRFHLSYIRKAFERGLSVLCEKPIARTFYDFGDLISLYEKKKKEVKFSLFTQYQTNPIFQKGQELIRDGIIGDVKRIKVYIGTNDITHTLSKEFFWTPKVSGGGALSDMGPHTFSVMWYWLQGVGDFKPVSVTAESLATNVLTRTIAGKPDMQVEVEDDALLEIEWEDAAGHRCEGHFEAVWGPLTAVSHKADKYGIYFEVEGTKGTMQFPNGTLGIMTKPKFHFGIIVFFKITRPDGTVEKIKMPKPKNHVEAEIMVDQFLDAVAHNKPTVNSFEYGLDMMRVIGAGYLSHKLDRPVTVPEFEQFCNEVAARYPDAEDPGYEIIKELMAPFKRS